MLLTAPENKLGWHCQGPMEPATQDAKLRAEWQETTAPGHSCTITTHSATAATLPSHSQNSVCDRNMRRRQNIDAPSIIQDATDVSFTLHCVSKFEVALNKTKRKYSKACGVSLLACDNGESSNWHLYHPKVMLSTASAYHFLK